MERFYNIAYKHMQRVDELKKSALDAFALVQKGFCETSGRPEELLGTLASFMRAFKVGVSSPDGPHGCVQDAQRDNERRMQERAKVEAARAKRVALRNSSRRASVATTNGGAVRCEWRYNSHLAGLDRSDSFGRGFDLMDFVDVPTFDVPVVFPSLG